MIPFRKMHGIGNDFVLIDGLTLDHQPDWEPLSRAMCDRRFGVGADGIILLTRGQDHPFQMRMFNPDGSESEMCGNGIRCLAVFASDLGHVKGDSLDVETGAGLLHLNLLPDHKVRVDMGAALFSPESVGMTVGGESFVEQPIGFNSLKGTAVSMGNPHLDIFVDDVKEIPLETWGPQIENLPQFKNRTNVHFIQVLNRGECIQRTWERGAGATLACGTGACSVAAAGVKTGRFDRDVLIHLPGGDLRIEVQDDWHIFMTGPAESVFDGSWSQDS